MFYSLEWLAIPLALRGIPLSQILTPFFRKPISGFFLTWEFIFHNNLHSHFVHSFPTTPTWSLIPQGVCVALFPERFSPIHLSECTTTYSRDGDGIPDFHLSFSSTISSPRRTLDLLSGWILWSTLEMAFKCFEVFCEGQEMWKPTDGGFRLNATFSPAVHPVTCSSWNVNV